MNVLISAYAVSPTHGSEPAVGWNWTIELAKYCNVYVITEAEFKNDINKALQTLSQKENIHFLYNDIGPKARKMCWNQGDYRFYYFYQKWQKETYKIAVDLIEKVKIDVIHHLNMIGYREPGYLWRIQSIPFVLGPIGGFTLVKASFIPTLGMKYTIFYLIKNFLNILQALAHTRVRKAIKRADLLLAESNNSYKAIIKYYGKRSLIMPETGCVLNNSHRFDRVKASNSNFNILWVGRFLPTKMLSLALETINCLKHLPNLKFHIVGDGINEKVVLKYKKIAQKKGLDNICLWYGKIPKKDVNTIMQKSDLLFFTSIIEGTSHVVLEAIANHLPILCFDNNAHGQIVDKTIGDKIPLINYKKSISLFTRKIEDYYNNRFILEAMTDNFNIKIKEFSWEKKVEKILSYYQEIIK